MRKPDLKPKRPFFSSGPCVKPPKWSCDKINENILGRSHRSDLCIDFIVSVQNKIRKILKIPDDFKIAITAGGATGACEMSFWNVLGSRPVDTFSWDVFGKKWADDVKNQLKIEQRYFHSSFSELPDLSKYNPNNDCCFTWLGTTSGVHIPNCDWIPVKRKGLTICDATSAVFSFIPPWDKLDVFTFSMQKVLGGEGAHGIVVLSPRAFDHINHYTPSWPIPALFNLSVPLKENGNKIRKQFFEGKVLNTPSMWCIADAKNSLEWLEEIGGISAINSRIDKNYEIVKNWIKKSELFEFCVLDESIRSKLAITIQPSSLKFKSLEKSAQWDLITKLYKTVEKEDAGYDFRGHIDSEPCLRIWCGPTVNSEDIEKLLPWIDYSANLTLKV